MLPLPPHENQSKFLGAVPAARMGQNFDDYPGPAPQKHLPKDIQHSVSNQESFKLEFTEMELGDAFNNFC